MYIYIYIYIYIYLEQLAQSDSVATSISASFLSLYGAVRVMTGMFLCTVQKLDFVCGYIFYYWCYSLQEQYMSVDAELLWENEVVV